MANLTFVPNAVSKSTGPALIPMDEIPQDVKTDVEQAYEALKSNPGRFQVSFPSLGELNLYITQVKSYCAQREAGEIRFRKSPTPKLPATTMEFRITDLLTKEEQTTEGIRDSAAKVNKR